MHRINNKLTLVRSISILEKEVIYSTLKADNKLHILQSQLNGLDQLNVISKCDCGCQSVFFYGFSEDTPYNQLADGVGTTSSGAKVGVIIWGLGNKITGLEVYSEGAENDDLKLPIPSSIRSWTSNLG